MQASKYYGVLINYFVYLRIQSSASNYFDLSSKVKRK